MNNYKPHNNIHTIQVKIYLHTSVWLSDPHQLSRHQHIDNKAHCIAIRTYVGSCILDVQRIFRDVAVKIFFFFELEMIVSVDLVAEIHELLIHSF